jgi:hypothetical protein
MSVPFLVVLAVLVAGAVVAIYLAFRARLRAAAVETGPLREQLAKSEADLGAARADANGWREKAEAEREARAAAETSAARVAGLESELAQLRTSWSA